MNKSSSRLVRRTLTATILITFALVSCSSEQAAVDQQEAEQAFIVSYAAMFVGSMTAALDHDRPGISVNTAQRTITLTDFDVTDLDTPYETVSGTITGEDGSSRVELTLVGGPAREVSFRIASDQMLVGDRIRQSVEVNGREFDIDLDRATLEL